MACHAARSTSLARIFTHTSRPAPRMCRCRGGGVRGGTAPRQPLPGTREAWPQRVGWLTGAKTAGLADLGRRVDLVERSDPRGEGDPALARALKRDTEGDWD